MLKILVADDHMLVREGLASALRCLGGEVSVVQAADGVQVMQQLELCQDFDLLLLDLYMPGMDGFVLLGNICNFYPDIPVVILSASDDAQTMRKSLDRGASGFIPKTTDHDVMLSALNLVIAGGVYIPPMMLKDVSNEIDGESSTSNTNSNDIDIRQRLTERQLEVLGLLAQGHQNKLIAKSLGVSEHTVKIHVTAILKALGVKNRTQAVLVAQQISDSIL